MKHVLEVKGLHIDIPLATGILHAVRDVTFSVERGKSFCLVGESGCGKSLTALAIMDLLPQTAKRKATMLSFEGKDLSAAKEREMADVRGRKMSMIFQEPMTSLNPCYSIGNQLEEALVRHKRVSRREARERAVFLLDKVGITQPAETVSSSALRRSAPAYDDRHGLDVRAKPDHCR
jgi:peptide/nickel transport system ATP-binding protein